MCTVCSKIMKSAKRENVALDELEWVSTVRKSYRVYIHIYLDLITRTVHC